MEARVWAEPIDREDYKLARGDIPEAIIAFKEQTGQEPKLLILSPKNEKFANEIPEGIAVNYMAGVLLGEVWLSAFENWGCPPTLETPPDATRSTTGLGQNSTTHIDSTGILSTVKPQKKKRSQKPARGRSKIIKLPERKILAFAAAGMGAKLIKAKLQEQYGIKVSLRTITRLSKTKKRTLDMIKDCMD